MDLLYPEDTGLKTTVWTLIKGNNKCSARCFVNNKYGRDPGRDDLLVISVSKNPKILSGECKLADEDLKNVFEWIILNHDAIVDHYNHKISSGEFVDRLQNI